MNLIDKMLEKIDRQNILHLYNDGSTATEIAKEMNISLRFVEQVIWEQEMWVLAQNYN